MIQRLGPLRSQRLIQLSVLGSFISLTLFSTTVLAKKKKAVILPFSGIGGAKAAKVVRQRSRAYTASYARYRRLGAGKKAAARLSVAALVYGQIHRKRGRFFLKLIIRSAHNRAILGRPSFALRGPRVDRSTARQIALAIARYTRRGKIPRWRHRRRPKIIVKAVDNPPPEPAAQAPKQNFDDGSDISSATPETTPLGDEPPVKAAPEPSAATNEVGGFAVAPRRRDNREDPSDLKLRDRNDGEEDRYDPKRKTGTKPPWRSFFHLFVGAEIKTRTFDFVDSLNPPQANSPTYSSGVHTALRIEGALFPFALAVDNPLADIGIVGTFSRVFGLKSRLDLVNTADTHSQFFEVGLRYRWNILKSMTSPVLMAGVEYGQQSFLILSDDTPLPNLQYKYLKLALLRADFPFVYAGGFRFGLGGAFDYLLVFSSGDIESPLAGGYGTSSTGAINAEAGLFLSYYGFGLRVAFNYRRFFFDFDQLCAIQNQGCNEAGGALDQYLGGIVTFGYSY